MAKAIDKTITYGILRIIEDFFRVIFGEWWTEFESHWERSKTGSKP